MQTVEAKVVTGSFVMTCPTNETDTGAANYDAVRFNAMQHGILSRHTVLAHEDPEEYWMLLAALVEDHQPAAATEAHLVEELAGIIWRKRRVLQAEGANISKGLKGAARDAEDVIPAAAPPQQMAEAQKLARECQARNFTGCD